MRTHLCTAALLAVIATAPAFAQQTTTGGTGTTTAAAPAEQDHGSGNWGWIGLLGLAGLAPLFMRKDRDKTVERR
jgi:hypothetical protein